MTETISNNVDYKVRFDVRSEYGKLDTVLVHRPGREIERLTPDNKGRLLFDDIPYLPRMQSEHDKFVSILRSSKIEVLYFRDLLAEVVTRSDRIKRRLIHRCCVDSLYPGLCHALLDHLEDDELVDVLICGITAKELEAKTKFEILPRPSFDRRGRPITPPHEDDADPFLVSPLPNMYFTRDIGFVLGEGFVSTKMHFDARVRESYLVREVIRNHPIFAGAKTWYGTRPDDDRPFTIEGGDVIVLSREAIAVGASQRTRPETIRRLAQRLFEEHVVERVYQILIPPARAYMHLDTVFTVVAPGIVVTYPHVMNQVVEIRRFEPLETGEGYVQAIPVDERRSFKQVLADEFGVDEDDVGVVETGGGDDRIAAREQAADGTNVFAVAPGVVVTYDRNARTNAELEERGITVTPFDGSELVRGLGGPRCMTMPLCRQE